MTTMTPASELDRVRRHTNAHILEKIEDDIEQSIRYHTTQPSAVITRRIETLEREWSMERWLETNASTVAFTGVALGLAVDRKWLVLPLLVSGFLFLHAVRGWCPPLPLLRRLGVRTRSEIDREKFALKLLRGDFQDLETRGRVEPREARKIMEAVNA
jgi:hypothetical protein